MRTNISSVSNPHIKSVAKLRTRRGRRDQQKTIIDGVREVYRAGISQVELEEVFICQQLLDGEEADQLINWIGQQKKIKVTEVTSQVMEKIAFGNRAEGAVAVIAYPKRSLEQFRLPKSALVVVVEGVEKPGNVGAILRTADAVGADCVISADGKTDLFNPNAIRASLGTIFSVPIFEVNTETAKSFLAINKVQAFAARVDGAKNYSAVDYRQPCAIVLGSEADGLTDQWQGSGVQNISLPMNGIADSLNVSTAAAVLLYEALRQRT